MNKKFWYNPYIVYIVTSIITLVVGIIYRNGIFNALLWIWNHILNEFIYFKVWWIIISSLLILILIKGYKILRKKAYLHYVTDKIELPPWAESISEDKRDRIITWEWEYKTNEPKPIIENIYPICRNCGTVMQTDYEYLRDFSVLVAYCPRCYLKFQIPDLEDIKSIIYDNIRRKHLVK